MNENNELLLFFGRFHPLVVHLPIGLLFVALLMEIFAGFGRFRALKESSEFVLFLAALTSVLAALVGYLLSLSGGYDADLLAQHQWAGIAVAVLAVVAYWAKTRKSRAAYWPSLLGSCVALTLAGHWGGSLTHGENYLTEYMPAPLRELAGLPPRSELAAQAPPPPTDPNQALVFAHVVQPIMHAKCENCHNQGKQKGGLRLDKYDFVAKGGENGAIFTAGKATESEMYKVLLLPEADDHHMPPKGKPQLTKEEIALIGWWIDQGAKPDQTLAQAQKTPEIEAALKMVGLGGTGAATATATAAAKKVESEVYKKQVPAPDAAAIKKLKDLGILVAPIALESHLLRVQAGLAPLKGSGQPFADQHLALLAPLAPQIVWLDLGNTQVTDAGLATVGQMPNLVKLALPNTQVTDAGLDKLAPLAHLEYLNLYGTALTDNGLAKLAPLKRLQALYVWQTKVTEAGAKQLQTQLPGLAVDLGWQPNAAPAKVEAKKKA
ncbi:MAG: ribonuclease inhibitor [Bernardetiaceae bacterium]|jgi:uncharacterized membrane protein|nr:ribonuclease inhibitor [Bernardetiaceae bacterium]